MRRWLLSVLAALLLAGTVGATDLAEEQRQAIGIDGLQEGLTGETATLMEDLSPVETTDLSHGLSSIWQKLLPQLDTVILGGVRTAISLMAVVILCSMVTQMETKLSKNAVLMAGTLAITLLSAANVHTMVGLGRETLQELQSFSGLLLPVMAAATAASGGVNSAGALYAASVLVSNILMTVINYILIPILYAYLAVSAANAVLGNQTLARVRELGRWIVTNGLKLTVFAFTGYLSLSGILSGATDQSTLKATKLAMGAAVPVVGSMISDASETVLVSAGILRSSAGVFGMLVVVAICLLPLIRLGVQHLLLKLTTALSSTVGEKPLVDLIESVSDVMGFLMGMTGASAFMLLISCVCSLKVVSS